MNRKARVAKSPRTTRSFRSSKPQSGRGTKVSLQRVAERNDVQGRERDLERGPVGEAREALVELFDLLEEYGPSWYSEAHRAKALAAINALEES
jgi:hypothetical protein